MIGVVITPFGEVIQLQNMGLFQEEHRYRSKDSDGYREWGCYREYPSLSPETKSLGICISVRINNDSSIISSMVQLTNVWPTAKEAWQELQDLYRNDFKIIIPTKYLNEEEN